MRKIGDCEMKSFGTLESREKALATLEDRWLPQTIKQGD